MLAFNQKNYKTKLDNFDTVKIILSIVDINATEYFFWVIAHLILSYTKQNNGIAHAASEADSFLNRNAAEHRKLTFKIRLGQTKRKLLPIPFFCFNLFGSSTLTMCLRPVFYFHTDLMPTNGPVF